MSTRNTLPSAVRSPSSRMTSLPRRVKKSSLSMLRAPDVVPLSGNSEDQIDVGGEIELAATELAHAEHDERLALARARCAARRRYARDPGWRSPPRLDGRVGKRAGVRQRLGERGPARKVAPGNAHHLAFPLAAQRRHEPGEVGFATCQRADVAPSRRRASGRVERGLVDQPFGEGQASRARLLQTKSLAASTRGNASRSSGAAASKTASAPDSRTRVSCCSQ